MKNVVDADRFAIECKAGSLAGIGADTDDSSRLECVDDGTQGAVTSHLKWLSLVDRQFVWRPIPPGILKKREWTPVPDEEATEKVVNT